MSTLVDNAFGSGLKASPHCRRNAMPNAMKRMLPIPLASSVLYRRRTSTSATQAM